MQLIPVYLYPNKIDVFTNALAPWLKERYRQVYQRNLKIYRGVDNRIDLQVRNSDEKAAETTGSLVFNLVERNSQKLILKTDCIAADPTKGRFYIVINSLDLGDIEPGFYEYSITKEIREDNTDGTYRVTSRTPLYCDSQYGTIGTLEIFKAGTGEAVDSTHVTSFLLHDPAVIGVFGQSYYVSSIIDARPEYNNPQSLHTFQFNFTEYSGPVIIQGSIDNGGTPKNWTDLEVLTIGQDETVRYTNITGKWNWFRIKQNASKAESAQWVVGQSNLGTYYLNLDDGGYGYRVGDILTIYGNQLGGVAGVNDITIRVTMVDAFGRIYPTGFSFVGTSIVGYKTFVVSASGIRSTGRIDKVLYR